MQRQPLHNSQLAIRRTLPLPSFLVMASMLFWMAFAVVVQAQTSMPPPAPRDALIQAIQQRARTVSRHGQDA